jgi:hypothetical protein
VCVIPTASDKAMSGTFEEALKKAIEKRKQEDQKKK